MSHPSQGRAINPPLDIVIATGNAHKFRELKKLLPVRGIHWHSLAGFPKLPPVHENGRSFDANAVKKARVVARATGFLALADDSGIEVDALGGAPGIRSARFSGAHSDDQANNAKLLGLMQGVPAARRGARYHCSLALASSSRTIALTRGTWAGRITTAAKGHGGFGYDPVVLIPRLGKTVAQLTKKVKRQLSHRSVAARKMLPILTRLARPGDGENRAGTRPGSR